jgi:hypothetical protein
MFNILQTSRWVAVNRARFSAAQPFFTHELDLSQWKLDAAFHRWAGMAEILLFLQHASKQFSGGFGHWRRI